VPCTGYSRLDLYTYHVPACTVYTVLGLGTSAILLSVLSQGLFRTVLPHGMLLLYLRKVYSACTSARCSPACPSCKIYSLPCFWSHIRLTSARYILYSYLYFRTIYMQVENILLFFLTSLVGSFLWIAGCSNFDLFFSQSNPFMHFWIGSATLRSTSFIRFLYFHPLYCRFCTFM
jgi:hypothetical protein